MVTELPTASPQELIAAQTRQVFTDWGKMSVSSDHDRAPRGDEEEAWECAAEDTCGTIELATLCHTTQPLHLNILPIRQPGPARGKQDAQENMLYNNTVSML